MKLHYALATTILMSAANPAFARGTSAEDFVQKASVANMFEIESSRIALTKSKNSDVQEFAQDMLNDHTKTGEKMKEALDDSNTGLKPAEKLDAKHAQQISKLKAAKEADFDKQYIQMQVTAHNEAVELFDEFSKYGQDSELKEFARDTLPTLKEHLQHVEQIELAKK